MIFFAEHFEEEEEEEGGIDDALLVELADELDEDDLLAEELDPLLKVSEFDTIGAEESEDTPEDPAKIFEEEEEEEEDMDYDSFDDHDEL